MVLVNGLMPDFICRSLIWACSEYLTETLGYSMQAHGKKEANRQIHLTNNERLRPHLY
jgi:hypothetical protein